MMMTTTTMTSTTTLFTISMTIAIVGMMNAVPIVLGADVKQAESNLCYAVRLDKECNAVTDGPDVVLGIRQRMFLVR